ncbi:MAG: lysylphosphatidylglycerol synthase transmembrane domain-containing protein [Elusimicrobiales bacterium]|nr:lysylphosphatidylglycerol synthase transmembrane domain-containing protein [Elusimicrobiales bacterium]HOL62018.1 lysylphosphatidylglycerol synthase transmembrane domain-containing protein [Elusimicrobiales bacterium]HPO95122.1 lysylphosphatidylglycerol synthase transmembrane domain-containing protein [Elusimicrobiales bacterium]
MKTKDILIASLGIIISFLLIYLSFKNADFSKFLLILKKSDISFMFLFLISTFFELVFRTLKWYLILKPNVTTDLKQLFKIEVISLGINNILPFRMGEITKIFLVSHFYAIPKTTVLSTVFIERLMDTLILFALLLLYSKLGGINILINKTSFFVILNFAIIAVIILFIFSDKIMIHPKVKKFQNYHPKIHSFIIKIKNGGVCFKSLGLTFLILGSGIIQWNFDVLNNFFMAKALKIHAIDFFKAAISVFAGSLSASVPSMPGYFGNYEYAVSRVCMSWGIDKETSLLFATSVHILGYIVITLAAVIFIYSLGLNFRKILSMSKNQKEK